MHKLLLILSLCISLSATAQDFKILFVNTGTIRIGGKELKAGDVFNHDEIIHWTEPKQAMEVLSLADMKQYMLVSEDFKDRKMKSAKDYLVKSNRLSTRGSGSLSSVTRQVGETIYVMDSTRVPISYVPDKSEYFFLLFGEKRHKLAYSEGNLFFDADIFNSGETLTADLFFHYADGEEECLIEGLCIILLPTIINN